MAKDFRSNLRDVALKFAEQFADELIALVRASSMADVFGSSGVSATTQNIPAQSTTPARRGRRARGRAADLSGTIASITELLANKPDGLRAEQLRDELKLDKPTVTKALTAAL